MAVKELPVRSDSPSYRFQLVLENRIYFFEFRFNTRWDTWTMDIQSDAQVELINGIPLQTGVPILDGYTIEGLPPGIFVCLDTTGKGLSPTRENFGGDVKLLYVESSSI